MSSLQREAAAEQFHRWCFRPRGTEGYRTAEVTLGGISTAEFSSKTFEAKSYNGLYVIGEALDVRGWLGGYNFQWAWASDFAVLSIFSLRTHMLSIPNLSSSYTSLCKNAAGR